MTELTILLLTTLHSELSGLNGHICVADKNASYPLMTYNILNSAPTRAKSFTSDGYIFTVQFSYFDDKSFLNCLNLATSAETKLQSLSAFLDIDNGNVTTLGNTEQNKFYQYIDTRNIEILKDLIPVVPPTPVTYTVEYFGNGNDSGTVPVDNNSPYVSGSTVTVLGNSGNLAKSGYTFNDWNSLSAGTGTDYSSGSTFTINSNTNLFAKWTSVAPVNYLWTGTIDGDYEKAGNYTPNGIPTSIDNVQIDDTYVNIPYIGALTCNTLTLINNNPFSVEVNYGEITNINASLIIMSPGTINRNVYPNDVSMYGTAINYGAIDTATMYPAYEEAINYPENNGTIDIANVYWNEGDYLLGGTVGTINYLGPQD